MKDLKYLFAYTVPVAAFISFASTGVGTYSAVIYAFVVLPFLDVVLGKNTTNLDEQVACVPTCQNKVHKLGNGIALDIELMLLHPLHHTGVGKVLSSNPLHSTPLVWADCAFARSGVAS